MNGFVAMDGTIEQKMIGQKDPLIPVKRLMIDV